MNNRAKPTRRGRPPLPPEKVRANRVVTFLTDPQLDRLKKISREDSETISSLCYRIISGYIDQDNRKFATEGEK